MKITYFVNQYPKVSHSFIRREILALEQAGVCVHRVSIRGWDADVVDPLDKEEKGKTSYVLQGGIKSLLGLACSALFNSPRAFFKALSSALKMSRMSERNALYHIIYLLEACKLKQLCENEGSEHIHAHFGTNSTEIAMLCHLLGGPGYSFTVHGPEEFDKPQGLHLKEKVAHSKFVAAISSFGRSQLYRWCDYADWDKIKVVHCGLDADFFGAVDKTQVLGGQKQLLCIGRLCEQKGQLLLIEGVKKARDSGADIRLVLAGDGEMRNEVEALVERLELSEYVSITGWISSSKVQSLLRESDAMILPSFGEGLPVAIMEALATKTPVITTYIAGIPELIEHRETGWLCAAGDPDAIAESIIDFAATPTELVNEITEKAFLAVKSRHCIDTEAKKLALYFSESLS
ncbi:colanic acid biosynthesis glycosyltransferase WcaL [Corallincola holothuriorum]|uniref:Colanic acid biosynthesis glycosyltransferase WcaL n=1 Tax=Corallincola holothuriorum TaxID=2282215 RepID=A0A368NH11_9GAMM|nr:glycosyltransferase family 4 protein [Corallincola holothuriorum]RCU49466.1 colanic acid biosynthesis glycosyltransferase WcaL [Corallincola holothuriorum]